MNDSIYILIAWGIYLLARYLNNERKEDPAPWFGEREVKREIEYLVNGLPISGPHDIFYLNVLQLGGKSSICESDIKEASSRIANRISVHDGHLPLPDMADVDAARQFLLDHWCYLAYKN